ncbi:hypothetical protein KIPB_005568 [Kipferlia bialata]|uniref:Uncharacterized protein n=1 Tax=Kipferlia bialata TaxID=797122 RepID=A0A9K3GFG7_9EUKA|nr:hypothetical protein KIPB_001331 [Kipferlia bialata]GIQ80573.1 hypothetical protein KIPB_001398 [Kipferlia bialata]GIQ80755.1 hypothetical protein KIPB_001600 [Kipferlia bialata]GIQ81226.1 hypothetical protein KIPB_002152 [Kipferlia bialata]GIQ82065.1 hypothetical protein KIPB_003140 [Kipferlia bialata]|eukprot:g1331.t1
MWNTAISGKAAASAMGSTSSYHRGTDTQRSMSQSLPRSQSVGDISMAMALGRKRERAGEGDNEADPQAQSGLYASGIEGGRTSQLSLGEGTVVASPFLVRSNTHSHQSLDGLEDAAPASPLPPGTGSPLPPPSPFYSPSTAVGMADSGSFNRERTHVVRPASTICQRLTSLERGKQRERERGRESDMDGSITESINCSQFSFSGVAPLNSSGFQSVLLGSVLGDADDSVMETERERERDGDSLVGSIGSGFGDSIVVDEEERERDRERERERDKQDKDRELDLEVERELRCCANITKESSHDRPSSRVGSRHGHRHGDRHDTGVRLTRSLNTRRRRLIDHSAVDADPSRRPSSSMSNQSKAMYGIVPGSVTQVGKCPAVSRTVTAHPTPALNRRNTIGTGPNRDRARRASICGLSIAGVSMLTMGQRERKGAGRGRGVGLDGLDVRAVSSILVDRPDSRLALGQRAADIFPDGDVVEDGLAALQDLETADHPHPSDFLGDTGAKAPEETFQVYSGHGDTVFDESQFTEDLVGGTGLGGTPPPRCCSVLSQQDRWL